MARPITAAIGLLLLLAGPVAAQTRSPTLDAVVARGQLVCGVGGDIPGFSLVDGQGVMRGLDADGCRAIAAAVLGDATKVRFCPFDHGQSLHGAAIGRDRLAVAKHQLDAHPRVKSRAVVRGNQFLGQHRFYGEGVLRDQVGRPN